MLGLLFHATNSTPPLCVFEHTPNQQQLTQEVILANS
jgi:hypothetical protein